MKKVKNKLAARVLRNSFLFLFGFFLIASIPTSLLLADEKDNMATNPSGITLKTQIKNPLGGVDDLQSLVKKGLDVVVNLGIPIVVLAIIYSGFLFIKAQGNKDKLVEAKKVLINTLIGAVVLLGAHVIAKAIGGTVQDISNSVSFYY